MTTTVIVKTGATPVTKTSNVVSTKLSTGYSTYVTKIPQGGSTTVVKTSQYVTKVPQVTKVCSGGSAPGYGSGGW